VNAIEEAEILREPVTAAEVTAVGATSWGAVLGGSVAAAALSLILLALGSGLGLSAISPWAYAGAATGSLGVATIVWLLAMSAVASAMGGYIAGRLRDRWPDVDAHEAFFRDTAHGFLAWGVATLVSAALLSSAASSMVGAAARTTAMAGGAAALGVAAATPENSGTEAASGYFVDMMFRGPAASNATAGPDLTATRREVAAIMRNAGAGEMPAADRGYLAQLVADRTGLAPAQADERVAQVTAAAKLAGDAAATKAREAAEAARKALAYTALWIFVSLLLGAFCASLAATWGGRQRDEKPYLRRPL
jgi:hypothetical protein